MTITETPAGATEAPTVAPAPATGFAALVGTGDPRTIGRLYIGASLLFLLMTGVLGALVSAEGIDLADDEILGADSFAQVFTLHTIGGIFLFGMPLLVGILAAVVPLQIGASTVAFPRALASSFWVYVVSGGLVIASYLMNGGPYGGDPQGVDLFVAAFIGLLLALSTAALVLATTVLTLRAPGMSLRRAPLLAWSTLVSGVVWLVTLPVLAALMVLVYVSHRYGPADQLFLSGNIGVYDRIAWALRHPTIYAFAIPLLGIIGDIVPVFSRRRHQMHAVAMTAIALFGVLSIGAWVQGGIGLRGTPNELDPYLFDLPWFAVSVGALLPLLILFALWGLTAKEGQPALSAPLLIGTLGFTLLDLAVVEGALNVFEQLDFDRASWLLSQQRLVVMAIAVVGLAALVFWAPKIWGVVVPERPAQALGALLWVAALVIAIPDAIAGAATPNDSSTLEALSGVSAAGFVLLVFTTAGLAGLLLRAVLGGGEAPGDDPWSGHTLEWTTSSPPLVGNFASLPAITSEAPLYDARHAERAGEDG